MAQAGRVGEELTGFYFLNPTLLSWTPWVPGRPTGGLCRPVVIAPSRRARRGGGVWEMDIRDPPWAQANFPPPPRMCRGGRQPRARGDAPLHRAHSCPRARFVTSRHPGLRRCGATSRRRLPGRESDVMFLLVHLPACGCQGSCAGCWFGILVTGLPALVHSAVRSPSACTCGLNYGQMQYVQATRLVTPLSSWGIEMMDGA